MKLLGDFFEIGQAQVETNGLVVRIKLARKHLVYEGHFPGQPVTPGVIQIQMVHEIMEWHLDKKIQLKRMPKCKFLHILNPREVAHMLIQLNWVEKEGELSIKAEGKYKKRVFFRFQAVYALILQNNAD